jgi:citrate/tricarballylate utilization protein
MTPDPIYQKAEHEMIVCNACRYCEAYCPVFQAMEQRVTFSPGDLTYLANLCHNCGECLYACQYAPPHEFGIEVPKTLSRLRVESYESLAWPGLARVAFRKPWAAVLAALGIGFVIVAAVARASITGEPVAPADFYGVIPHDAMVMLFGAIGLFSVAAVAIGHLRFKAGLTYEPEALRDALTLRQLHASGECVDAEEVRRPWRRWMHHCTFYGFALCCASTTVAAVYHLFLGRIAPYAYTSIPVVLGTAGGIGLLIGPAGLLLIDRRRDPSLTHQSERALGSAFLVSLFLTSLTGLILLVLREQPYMPALLVVHLAIVFALFITLPYGKFVHGVYRTAALVKFRREER